MCSLFDTTKVRITCIQRKSFSNFFYFFFLLQVLLLLLRLQALSNLQEKKLSMKEYLTIREIAELTGYSVKTLPGMFSRLKIKRLNKAGRIGLYDRSVLTLLAKQKAKAKPISPIAKTKTRALLLQIEHLQAQAKQLQEQKEYWESLARLSLQNIEWIAKSRYPIPPETTNNGQESK
jgi:hypothetical protein